MKGTREGGHRKARLSHVVQKELDLLAKKGVNVIELLSYLGSHFLNKKSKLRKYYTLEKIRYLPSKHFPGLISQLRTFRHS
ncbi:MAG: hypothetical protein Unbinned5081contig1003_49 [Prokaryotic dsDNA virus sp.]|nr:MAG: hypothetical protein Unbinned5081contig1003_49 [Prokaryotic dsDNA virus sp.]|tara:strand:- start:25592 stop:25834 length:243 start_codon:yes stop_codon:yes gene_type:complete